MNGVEKLSSSQKEWYDTVALATLVPTLVAIIDYYELWPGFRVAAFILTLLVVAVELCFRKIEEKAKKTELSMKMYHHQSPTC